MAGMEAVPKEILRAAYQRKPIYLLKIPLHYGLWAALGWALYQTQHHPLAIPIGIVISFAIANLIRGVEHNSGREALLTLEHILRSRRPSQPVGAPSQKSTVGSVG